MNETHTVLEPPVRWRMPEAIVWTARVASVAFVLLAVIAIVHDLLDGTSASGVNRAISIGAAIALIGFPLVLWVTMIRPTVVADSVGICIQNPIRRRTVPYDQIRYIHPEDAFVGLGPTLIFFDGTTQRVWALQGIIRRLLFKTPSRSDLFVDHVAALEASGRGGAPRDLHDPSISISPRGRITKRPHRS